MRIEPRKEKAFVRVDRNQGNGKHEECGGGEGVDVGGGGGVDVGGGKLGDRREELDIVIEEG